VPEELARGVTEIIAIASLRFLSDTVSANIRFAMAAFRVEGAVGAGEPAAGEPQSLAGDLTEVVSVAVFAGLQNTVSAGLRRQIAAAALVEGALIRAPQDTQIVSTCPAGGAARVLAVAVFEILDPSVSTSHEHGRMSFTSQEHRKTP
jgi:hypothetical protein